jgi:hypothetical protein
MKRSTKLRTRVQGPSQPGPAKDEEACPLRARSDSEQRRIAVTR